MIRDAGYYSDQLYWLVQSEAASGDAGAIAESFTDSADAELLWCRIEEPRGAEKIYWSALQSTVDCMVRVRGNPGVREVDRFQDPTTGTVYLILGVNREPTEKVDQVCACVEYVEATSAVVP